MAFKGKYFAYFSMTTYRNYLIIGTDRPGQTVRPRSDVADYGMSAEFEQNPFINTHVIIQKF